ncbi:MAG: lipoprotein [Actinomycetota bacterium]
MKQALRLVAAVGLSASLSGCGSFKGWFQDQAYGDYSVGQLSYDRSINTAYGKLVSSINETFKDDGTCFGPAPAATLATWKDDCTRKRHIVVGDLLALSNAMCEDHKRTIWGNEAATNIITGTLTNAFSGAATAVGGELAKSALAAAAAFSSAERSLVNESVYKNALVPVVVKKITDARPSLRSALMEKVRTNDIDHYPMNEAVQDVLDYHYTCSFMWGLNKALEEGAQPSKDAKIAKLDVRRMYLQGQMEFIKSVNHGAAPVGNAVYDSYQKEFDDLSKAITKLYTDQ